MGLLHAPVPYLVLLKIFSALAEFFSSLVQQPEIYTLFIGKVAVK